MPPSGVAGADHPAPAAGLFCLLPGNVAGIVYRHDPYVLVAMFHLERLALGGIHVAYARDLIEGVGDVHQILLDGGQGASERSTLSFLLTLGSRCRSALPMERRITFLP